MKKIGHKHTCLLLLVASLVLPCTLRAQSNILYGSSRNALINTTNPALFPSRNRFYLSMPGLNINLSSPLSYSNIFNYDSTQDKTIINANNVLDTLVNNRLGLTTNINAIGLGINLGKLFITISTQAKIDMSTRIPQGIATLINEGNYGHVGDDVIELIDGNIINARVYGEGAVGLGLKINDRLTVGARAKMLVGILDLSNSGTSLTLRTEPDYSSMTAKLNIDMNFSSAVNVQYDSASRKINVDVEQLQMPQNYGINFDFGARFKLGLFDFTASVLDFGPGIKWQENIKKVVSAREDNSFTFTGVDVSNLAKGEQMDSAFTQKLVDSLRSLIDFKVVDGGTPYWTSIPTKLNLGAFAHIGRLLGAGILFHGEFEQGIVKVNDLYKTKTIGFHSRTSIMARVNLIDWIEIVAAASVVQNNKQWNWFNPGVGITLSPFRTLQVYAYLDYVNDLYVVNLKQLNISVGLNVLVGGKRLN